MSDDDIAVTFHGKYHWGADQEFWRNPDISCTAKVVWILLRSAASMPNGVKISRLSRWAKRYPGGVGKDLQELIAAGYVRRTFGMRHGAIIVKVSYDLFDTPQTLENQQSPRKSKHGFRPTNSVERTIVKSKLVKSKLVKSFSSPPPVPPTPEEDIKLPSPFNTLLPTQLVEAHKLCKLNNLNLHQQAQALKGLVKDNPANYLLKVLRNGGYAGAAEVALKVKEAEASKLDRKAASAAQREAEEESRERANREAQELDAYFAGLGGEEQEQIKAVAAQLVPAVLRGSPVAMRVEIRKVLQAQQGGRA